MLPLFVFKEENSILVAATVIYIYNFESDNSIILLRELKEKKDFFYCKWNFHVHACHFVLFPRKNKVPFK